MVKPEPKCRSQGYELRKLKDISIESTSAIRGANNWTTSPWSESESSKTGPKKDGVTGGGGGVLVEGFEELSCLGNAMETVKPEPWGPWVRGWPWTTADNHRKLVKARIRERSGG